jgi:hypothetical protein
MKKSTTTSCIKLAMEKGGGTVRDIHTRLNADPKVKKLLGGKAILIQTVATALHKGDIKRNPHGWSRSAEGRPLVYTMAAPASVDTLSSASVSIPDALQPLLATIGAMCIGAALARTKTVPGTKLLADILATAAKNAEFPVSSSERKGQLRA